MKFLEDFQRDGETREPRRRAMYDAEPNQYLRKAAVQTLLQRGLGAPSKEQREADNWFRYTYLEIWQELELFQ